MASESGVVSKRIKMETMNSLSWFNGSRIVKEWREKFLLTGKFSDIQFDVGSEERRTFHAHRFCLVVESKKFAEMLLNSDSKLIRIEDIEPKIFEKVLK